MIVSDPCQISCANATINYICKYYSLKESFCGKFWFGDWIDKKWDILGSVIINASVGFFNILSHLLTNRVFCSLKQKQFAWDMSNGSIHRAFLRSDTCAHVEVVWMHCIYKPKTVNDQLYTWTGEPAMIKKCSYITAFYNHSRLTCPRIQLWCTRVCRCCEWFS